jgi:hypothetical protein
VPFAFTGTIDSLELVVKRAQLSGADKVEVAKAMQRASD